jgi:hypothetical protein
VAQQRLGLTRAVIIVWISSAVVGALLTSLFFQSRIGATIVTGTPAARHPLTTLAAFAVVRALVAAVAVWAGVRLVGFRVSYVVASMALLVPTVLITAVGWALASEAAGDSTGIAVSAYGVLLLPLQVLVGTLAPAYMIAAAPSATASSATTYPPQYPPPRP